jgi:flagellar biosynthesis/type III secretory pathway M-ring protein FliF/YscJ
MIACPAKNQWVTAMARYIVAILLLAIIAGPALAQPKTPGGANPLTEEYARKKKEAEAVEKEYNAARKNSDQAATPTRVDPWQNMRGADDSKTKR